MIRFLLILVAVTAVTLARPLISANAGPSIAAVPEPIEKRQVS